MLRCTISGSRDSTPPRGLSKRSYDVNYEGITRSTPAKGTVRTLRQQEELPLLRDHLLRLDRGSRHDRFHGFMDDSFIERYAAKCADDGTVIIGSQNQAMRALANKFGANLTFRHCDSTGSIDLKQQPLPELARYAIATPADSMRAMMNFNRAYWKLLLRMY